MVDRMDAILLAGAPIAPAMFEAGAPIQPAIEAISSSRDGIFDTASTPARAALSPVASSAATRATAAATATDVEVVVNNAGVLKMAGPLDGDAIDLLDFQMKAGDEDGKLAAAARIKDFILTTQPADPAPTMM